MCFIPSSSKAFVREDPSIKMKLPKKGVSNKIINPREDNAVIQDK